MKIIKAIFFLLFLFNFKAFTGGTSYTAEIIDLGFKGNDEFVMKLKQYEKPYNPSEKIKPKVIIIHLRHKSKLSTKEKYIESINSLLSQYKKGGQFKFGIMAEGYIQIKGKKNVFQSNGLEIIEEYSGEKVVYSFKN